MKPRLSKTMARPLGVRGHQKSSRLVGSHKAGGAAFMEAPTEGTAMLALEVDPRVGRITAQPFTVRMDLCRLFSTKAEAVRAEPRKRPVSVNGYQPLERIYTPDLLAELLTHQSWVVESKSATEVQNLAPALARRGKVLNELGFHYLVVPNTELKHRGLHVNLVNLRDAMRYQRANDTRGDLEDLNRAIAAQPDEFSLAEVKGFLSDVAIYLGLLNGVISFDLRSGHLGVKTVLRKAYGDLSHLQLLNFKD